MIKGDWNSGWSQLQCKLCLLTCSWSSVARVCVVRSLWQPNHSCNVFWGNILMLSNNMMPNARIFFMEVCFFKYLLLCCKNSNNVWNSNYFYKCAKRSTSFVTISISTKPILTPLFLSFFHLTWFIRSLFFMLLHLRYKINPHETKSTILTLYRTVNEQYGPKNYRYRKRWKR